MNRKELLHFEQCFEKKEYELVMQCCEFQRHRRPKLFDVRERLNEMHGNAGTCAYYFPLLTFIHDRSYEFRYDIDL